MSDTPNPYEDLEPVRTPATPGTSHEHTGAPTVLLRGLVRRCPRCGHGDLFTGPFTIRSSCPTCGLRLEREEGGFLGAMTVNFGLTTLVWIVVLVVWLVLDLPDVHVAALTITSLAVVGIFPLLFWPTSKTIWASVDFLVYRSDPSYASQEAAYRAPGNGGRS
ncbi:MAG: DUF983 domain-containing protein [Actinomycetota bacterium]